MARILKDLITFLTEWIETWYFYVLSICQKTPLARYHHMAVRMDKDIVVFGGVVADRIVKSSFQSSSNRFIWIYKLDIDRWKKYLIPKTHVAPEAVEGICAVALESDIYLHGGRRDLHLYNDVWKLSRSDDDGFSWSKIHFADDHLTPSPRIEHACWEHDLKLWIFGGAGPPLDGYLDEYGDYEPDHFTTLLYALDIGCDNQLHCFDPASQT